MNALRTVVSAFLLRAILVAGGVGLLRSCPTPTTARALPLVTWELGRVTRVVDGDTYDVLVAARKVRVRLLNVDAPETDQPFGKQATDSVARLLPSVRLVSIIRQGTDLYGRTLAVVRVGGRRVDSLLVVRGWAWAYDPNHVTPALLPQQASAVTWGRGLWKCGNGQAVPPALWRKLNAAGKRQHRGTCKW